MLSVFFSKNFIKTRRTSIEYFLGWKWALYSLIFGFVSVSDGANIMLWGAGMGPGTCVDGLWAGAVSGTAGLFGLFLALAVVYL